MAYQFTRKVLVEGQTFEADAVISKSDIPAGCLESLLGVRWLVEIPDPQPVVLAVQTPPVAEAPAAKPKKK